MIQDSFGCAVILTHHMTKTKRNQFGMIIPLTDDSVFGSVFFQAWVTQQFLFDRDRTSDTRILQCNVQRSGKIIERVNLKLNEPEPLYFSLIDEFPTKRKCLLDFLKASPTHEFTGAKIRSAIKLPKSTFYKEMKFLEEDGKVNKRIRNDEFYYSFKEPTS